MVAARDRVSLKENALEGCARDEASAQGRKRERSGRGLPATAATCAMHAAHTRTQAGSSQGLQQGLKGRVAHLKDSMQLSDAWSSTRLGWCSQPSNDVSQFCCKKTLVTSGCTPRPSRCVMPMLRRVKVAMPENTGSCPTRFGRCCLSWSCVRLEIEARYDRRHEPERASSRARELERLSRPGASGDADRLRARWGSPRSWLRSAFFCVLYSRSSGA